MDLRTLATSCVINVFLVKKWSKSAEFKGSVYTLDSDRHALTPIVQFLEASLLIPSIVGLFYCLGWLFLLPKIETMLLRSLIFKSEQHFRELANGLGYVFLLSLSRYSLLFWRIFALYLFALKALEIRIVLKGARLKPQNISRLRNLILSIKRGFSFFELLFCIYLVDDHL